MPMRLPNVESGHSLPARLKLLAIRVFSARRPPSVIKTLLYRPTFFGAPLSRVFQHALRGPSDWSVGERELMAAFVSSVNSCAF